MSTQSAPIGFEKDPLEMRKAHEKSLRANNFNISQIMNVDVVYHDSDDEADKAPVLAKTKSNMSKLSKEQLIEDGNSRLREDAEKNAGNSTPTNKKKSVVIIAPKHSVSRTGSNNQMLSSSGSSPASLPGVTLQDSAASFKTEAADLAWQNLNEKLDMLLRPDYKPSPKSSPKSSHRSLDPNGGGGGGSGTASPGSQSSGSLGNAVTAAALMQKKHSNRSLAKRLSQHNVNVDNNLYIDDEEEEEEVYGVAMSKSSAKHSHDILRAMSLSMDGTLSPVSSDDGDDIKPVHVRDLRRAGTYVHDQREYAAQSNHIGNILAGNTSQQIQQQMQQHGNNPNGIASTGHHAALEESGSDKQKKEYEEKLALLERQAQEQRLQMLVMQQQMQIQQLQQQQQAMMMGQPLSPMIPGQMMMPQVPMQGQQSQAMLQLQQRDFSQQQNALFDPPSPVPPQQVQQQQQSPMRSLSPAPVRSQSPAPSDRSAGAPSSSAGPTAKTLGPKTQSIEEMAIAYIKEAQSLAASTQSNTAASAVVAVAETWKASPPTSSLPAGPSPPPFPTAYPPQSHYPQQQQQNQAPLAMAPPKKELKVTNSVDDLIAIGMTPSEAQSVFQEHMQAMSQTSGPGSQHNSRSSSPRVIIPGVEMSFIADPNLSSPMSRQSDQMESHSQYGSSYGGGSSSSMGYSDEYPSPRPPVVPQAKYVPLRPGESPAASSVHRPGLTPPREDYPPSGKLKKAPSRFVNDDVSIVSDYSDIGDRGGYGVNSPARPGQMSMPPLHSSNHTSPATGVRRLESAFDMDNRSVRSSGGGLRDVPDNASVRSGGERGGGGGGLTRAASMRPVRQDAPDASHSSTPATGPNGHTFGRMPSNHSLNSAEGDFASSHMPPPQPLSRQVSSASMQYSSQGSGGYMSSNNSHHSPPYSPQPSLGAGIPYPEYLSILDDTRSPDDVALDLGMTLSKQEARYGCTMFEWFQPQDEPEVGYLMNMGYARNTAVEMLFDRAKRR